MSQPHRRTVPPHVTDVLLWLLATDVAAQHLPDPDRPGHCANLRCHKETYPCPPAGDAYRACRAATRPTLLARGRARVIVPAAAAAARFAGWFRPTRPQQRPTSVPRAA
ncbi:hypothetical protein [Micromonospora inositola]|uniref:Uncharacterized protein n=1 Tax=Micromonospora inositola TaxID=47865 RepID=A0A1C5K4N8_9ACTN|nr:hypothetical protein [Micromonospora inositola]SCG77728.1 hypothetical protein GA0070613_6354 [Micromonospora inositola]